MSRISMLFLLIAGFLNLAPLMFAATTTTTPTFVVGTCKPGFPSYTSISAAVTAAPSGSRILVCPGTYNEQVHITLPLTLQGIASGNSDQAVIAPPGGGLATNAADDFGSPLAVQLWVDNAAEASQHSQYLSRRGWQSSDGLLSRNSRQSLPELRGDR